MTRLLIPVLLVSFAIFMTQNHCWRCTPETLSTKEGNHARDYQGCICYVCWLRRYKNNQGLTYQCSWAECFLIGNEDFLFTCRNKPLIARNTLIESNYSSFPGIEIVLEENIPETPRKDKLNGIVFLTH